MGIQINIDATDALDARNQMELLLYGGLSAMPANVRSDEPAVAAPEPVGPIDRSPSPTWQNATAEPAPVAEEAPKRKRRTRAEIAADEAAKAAAEAPAQAISESPEDRRDPDGDEREPDVEDAEEADEDDEADDGDDDLVGGFAVTSEGLVAAMQAHVAKFGLEQTEKHGPALFGNGYVKRRDVVEAGEEAIRGALRRFVGAIQSGKAGG